MSEAEFIKQASEAWEEAIKIAESTTGWNSPFKPSPLPLDQVEGGEE